MKVYWAEFEHKWVRRLCRNKYKKKFRYNFYLEYHQVEFLATWIQYGMFSIPSSLHDALFNKFIWWWHNNNIIPKLWSCKHTCWESHILLGLIKELRDASESAHRKSMVGLYLTKSPCAVAQSPKLKFFATCGLQACDISRFLVESWK